MPTGYRGAARYGAGKQNGDSGSLEDRSDPGRPDRRADRKPRPAAPAGAGPAQPQGREDAEHEAIRRANKAGPRFAYPRRSEAASRSLRTRPGRSPGFALFPHQTRGVKGNGDWLTRAQPVAQLRQRRPLAISLI